jgi:integrase
MTIPPCLLQMLRDYLGMQLAEEPGNVLSTHATTRPSRSSTRGGLSGRAGRRSFGWARSGAALPDLRHTSALADAGNVGPKVVHRQLGHSSEKQFR